ncbi:hypothetical protein BE17_53530 [Sorangium cellulosum]|uniref:Uncharacterized protein n=1 Tax=Sorangium cellulosum TaxID=56 RepID=A0A150RWI2_SORCE|nr:hypothetical protein BE17_53530 [Sorangium cellulosum]
MPGGKFALLEVPDLNGGQPSYLRLGAAAPLGESAGDDLAERIQTFTDDTRKRDGSPGFVPEGERQAETAKLHTKGGWRDHSDGNRISTTKGDKVEVIGGNYRLLILGHGEHQAGWDISGGHITEVSETFGGGTTIEWVQNYGGTWKVVETTIKGEVHTTYHGDVYDTYYGKIKQSQTGTDTFPTLQVTDDYLDDTNPPSPQSIPTENPEIIDNTWAKSISSYTGSEKLPVPKITNETWAEVMVSKTHATSMTDETTVKKASTSTMKAESITSSTTVDETMEDTTKAKTIKNDTTADKIISVTHADTKDEMYGDADSYTKGDSKTVVDGIETTINLGMVNEVVLGAMVETTLGGEATFTAGGTVEVTLGAKVELSMTASVDFSIGPKLELGTAAVELHNSKTEVALTNKVLSPFTLFF